VHAHLGVAQVLAAGRVLHAQQVAALVVGAGQDPGGALAVLPAQVVQGPGEPAQDERGVLRCGRGVDVLVEHLLRLGQHPRRAGVAGSLAPLGVGLSRDRGEREPEDEESCREQPRCVHVLSLCVFCSGGR
jgi:hypothetical protein